MAHGLLVVIAFLVGLFLKGNLSNFNSQVLYKTNRLLLAVLCQVLFRMLILLSKGPFLETPDNFRSQKTILGAQYSRIAIQLLSILKAKF